MSLSVLFETDLLCTAKDAVHIAFFANDCSRVVYQAAMIFNCGKAFCLVVLLFVVYFSSLLDGSSKSKHVACVLQRNSEKASKPLMYWYKFVKYWIEFSY